MKRKSNTSHYNPYALLHWLMQEERTKREIETYTGVTDRQVQRLLREIDRSGVWRVCDRWQNGYKLFWVEQKGQVQRLIRQSVSTPKLVTASEYAALCGVHRTSIRDRIKHGTLTGERRKSISGRVSLLINVEQYPPVRHR